MNMMWLTSNKLQKEKCDNMHKAIKNAEKIS